MEETIPGRRAMSLLFFEVSFLVPRARCTFILNLVCPFGIRARHAILIYRLVHRNSRLNSEFFAPGESNVWHPRECAKAATGIPDRDNVNFILEMKFVQLVIDDRL